MNEVNETREASCDEKAKAQGMPRFTLIAQDITSDLVVDFWTLVQLRVSIAVAKGRTVQEALEEVRTHFGLIEYRPIWQNPKLDGAAEIARAMQRYPTRRLAD